MMPKTYLLIKEKGLQWEEEFCFVKYLGVGVEGPSRGDPVKGWKMMGCSVRSDNLF